MKFRILSGGYAQNGELYHKDDIVETDDPLDEIFNVPGSKKYKRLDSFASNVAPDSPLFDVGADKGDLVDGDFDFSPEETGLHVYKKDKKFHVYDTDNLETPLNDDGLTKSKVMPFIRSLVEG